MARGVSPFEARGRVDRGEYRWEDMFGMLETMRFEAAIATPLGVFPARIGPARPATSRGASRLEPVVRDYTPPAPVPKLKATEPTPESFGGLDPPGWEDEA